MVGLNPVELVLKLIRTLVPFPANVPKSKTPPPERVNSPVTVSWERPGVRATMLLLLQISEETVRFVVKLRPVAVAAPPSVTAPVPRALVLATCIVPALMRVPPE